MKKQTIPILIALLVFSAVGFCEKIQYPVGERLSYRILWGILPVGRAFITCEQITENNAPYIRIRVEAKSNRMISTLYPVNDQIDCFVDPATGLPLRIEKKTTEGSFVCDDTLLFDRENLSAQWQSRSASITTNYTISSNTLDVAAFLYTLRSIPFTINEPKIFKIATDGYLHGLTITAEEKKQIKVGSEKTWCTRFSAIPERDNLFVRKIPGDIWVTDDTRRLMVQMRTKTPVGSVSVVLDETQ
ncbi:MAG TPA: DUF3108 domain-containing protein [Pontiellaceae bacterium]|nr:DUF3108 domain-containing protein [Pontiellaceae bacterium]